MIRMSGDHLLSCLAQGIFQATVTYCRLEILFSLKDNPYSKTGSSGFLVSLDLYMLYSCPIFCPLNFFFRSASSCLCRPHRRRNVSQVNLTTETFSLHIFPAYSTQFFLKTPSFSLRGKRPSSCRTWDWHPGFPRSTSFIKSVSTESVFRWSS